MTIRPARPSDRRPIERLIAQLQDFERRISSDRLPGAGVARRYYDHIRRRCRESRGRIFVAEDGARVVGYVCVWVSREMTVTPRKSAYVSDVCVEAGRRRAGIGQALLAAAEEHARALRLKRMKIGVLARNAVARGSYEKFGFRILEETWVRPVRKPVR